MKTTNKFQKTDKRHFGKTAIRTSIVMIGLSLFSMTVNAIGFGKQLQLNNSLAQRASILDHYERMGLALIPANAFSELSHTFNAFSLEASAEKNLEIEAWMTNEKYFAPPVSSFEMEVEEPLNVEEWMLTAQNFMETTIIEESDSALNIEKWMLDESIWEN